MELERLLRSQGFGSRPECRALVRAGRVAVSGAICEDSCADFDPEGLQFSVDSVLWRYRRQVYLVLNKPAGFECSHSPQFHPSIYSLLPSALVRRGVQAVGRLDEDTTGILLLSDDGQFIHRYTSPKKKIGKRYEAIVKHPVDAGQLAALRAGVVLNGEKQPIAATACDLLAERCIRITVTEGKYHLVKRMIAAAGNRVEALTRVAIGGLVLPDSLTVGAWAWLDERELERLAGKTDGGA